MEANRLFARPIRIALGAKMLNLFEWRRLIASKNGPPSPTTRHLLLTASLHMDEKGESCFPSTRTIAEETGLSERSVICHLAMAVATQWLVKEIRGLSGQCWRRHEYKARIPLKLLKQFQQLQHEGTEVGSAPISEGAEPYSYKVLKEVQSSSSNNTPKKKFNQDSDQIRLASLLFDLVREKHPKAKAPDLQKWAKHIDFAIRVDGRTPGELEQIIRWCQADSFWSGNILSTDKLRAKFDQLWLKMRSHSPKPIDLDAELRRCL